MAILSVLLASTSSHVVSWYASRPLTSAFLKFIGANDDQAMYDERITLSKLIVFCFDCGIAWVLEYILPFLLTISGAGRILLSVIGGVTVLNVSLLSTSLEFSKTSFNIIRNMIRIAVMVLVLLAAKGKLKKMRF
ncbi:uncharacterized protein LOC144348049 [Saccoglossus kowalevskii]